MTALLLHSPGAHDIGPAAVALGVFDGVHVGHQALVSDTIALAHARGIASVVLTFDRDPDQVVTPGRAAPQLSTLEDKLDLLAALGPDAVLVVPFTEELAALTPAQFCERVLCDATEPVACVVGYDFRFGAKAAGDAATLRSLGELHGFEVITHPLVRIGGAPVTSSRIRALVSSGDVAQAAELLGRPHRLHGTVVHGRGAGRELGTPTANIDVDPRFALPAPGVYAAFSTVPAGRFPSAVSTGVPPMFPDATCVLEAHLIGIDQNLYGQPATIEFVEHLRDQQTYGSAEALSAAIAADVSRVAELLARQQRP